MKRAKRTSSGFLVAALVLSARAAFAHGNARGEAKATIGRAHVTITYAKPKLNGRDPLALLEPGYLWRLGADIPTTMLTDKDLDFGGIRVSKGSYILLARLVERGRWTLILSTQPIRKYQPSTKVAEVPLTLRANGDSVEELSIQLTSHNGQGEISIAWGKYRLSAKFVPAA